MKPQVIIYTRVSSEQQNDGYSLTSQEERCRAYAAMNGYEVMGVFQDIKSGEGLDRPGLNQVFERVNDAQIRSVLVYSIDRLTRGGPTDFAIIATRLAQKDVGLEFVLGDVSADSPEGVLSVQLQSSIAWYENQVRRERFIRSQVQAAKHGVVLAGARPPYGYVLQAGKLLIEPAEAAVVRQIFDWAVAGLSIREITRRLCADAVPTRADSYRAMSKKNGPGVWSASTVIKILHQETYTGVWHYRKTQTVRIDGNVRLRKRQASEQIPIAIPAIVTTEVFNAAQVALEARRPIKTRPTAALESLLRGRVYCTCGRQCALEVGGSMLVYRCRVRRANHWVGSCDNKTYERAQLLDEAVWRAIGAGLLDPVRLHTWLADWRQACELKLTHERELLAAALAVKRSVENQLGLLLDQVLTGDYVTTVLSEEQEILSRMHREIEKEIAMREAALAQASISPSQETALVELAQQLRTRMVELDLFTRQKIMEILQVRAHMVAKHTARIEAVVPLADATIKWDAPITSKRGGGSGQNTTGREINRSSGRKGNETEIVTTSSAHCDHLSKLLPTHVSHVPAL